MTPWRPLPGPPPDPRPLGASLDRISQSLGGPPAAALATIFAQWETIVGDAVAAHSWPLNLARETLTIGVDQPGWATQLTYLEADLVRRIAEATGTDAVRHVRVTVRPK
jgi:predicted nucleic acid-binding Zn ribbon protein